jgi:hypothetical protein
MENGNGERKGCWGVVLALFGGGTVDAASEALPYRLRDDFLSQAELSFYRNLRSALGEETVICVKVRLGDLFYVPRAAGSQGAMNRIQSKHVDFLLCDPQTMKPRLGIELDDASHARSDRQERNELVERVFQAAGLPLLRVPVRVGYSLAKLREEIAGRLKLPPQTPPPGPHPVSGPPACPKCGAMMVLRKATRGERAGQGFFGCPNYPKCRGIVD